MSSEQDGLLTTDQNNKNRVPSVTTTSSFFLDEEHHHHHAATTSADDPLQRPKTEAVVSNHHAATVSYSDSTFQQQNDDEDHDHLPPNRRARRSTTGPWPLLEYPFQTKIVLDYDDDDDNNSHDSLLPSSSVPSPLQRINNMEATGQAMDSAAKGILHSSAGFFGPALIQVAIWQQQAAKSNSSNIMNILQPSSLLTVSNVLATICAALLLPILGAVLDRSEYRKPVGAATAYILAIINLIQIGLTNNAFWPLFWILHTISDILYSIHNLMLLSYLQNLTSVPSLLAQYTSRFAMIQFSFMTLYMFLMIVYAKTRTHGDIVQTSRMAHIWSGSVGSVLLVYSWRFLFGHRAAVVAETDEPASTARHHSLWFRSVAGLLDSITSIRNGYPALKYFLWTLVFSPNVGGGSYFSIFSTIQKSLLQMSSTQIGLANLIALLSVLVGARVSACITSGNIDPLLSFQWSILTLMIATTLVAVLVQGPEQLVLYYGLSALQCLALGWLVPTEKVLFCTLSPKHRQAEMMGVLLCVHMSFSWLPPLLFSIINEAGYSLRWALASDNLLLLTALFLSWFIGDYKRAVEQTNRGADGG